MKKIVYEILPKFEIERRENEIRIKFDGVSTDWMNIGRAHGLLGVLQTLCEKSETDISTVTAMLKSIMSRKLEGNFAVNLNEYWSDDDSY